MQTELGERVAQMLVQRRHAVVVEASGDGAEHRQRLGVSVEQLAVARPLPAHVPQGVLCPATLELVDHDDFGEVEHVDLLELGRRTELGRHHVHRKIHVRHDRRIALADARRLHDHEVRSPCLGRDDDIGEPLGKRGARGTVGGAGGKGSEEDLAAVERVHPDPVAQERSAATPSGGIDRDDGDAQLVRLVEPETAQQLVRQRGLAGATSTGDAEHRHAAGGCRRAQIGKLRIGHLAGLDERDRPRQRPLTAGEEPREIHSTVPARRHIARSDHRVDHHGQAQLLAILGREDARHPAPMQLLDLRRNDHTATAAVDPDVAAPFLAQAVEQVGEVLHVPALVGADRHALHVLLYHSAHHILDAAVVAEVDHLCALRLEDAPHDVDRGVMAVEQARGCHEPHRMLCVVQCLIDVHGNSLVGR